MRIRILAAACAMLLCLAATATAAEWKLSTIRPQGTSAHKDAEAFIQKVK